MDVSQSDQEKKRITVEINKRSYTIVGYEQPHHIRMVSSLVDQKMREIHESNRSLDTAKLAVLTAVNTMSEYVKLKEECTELMNYIDKMEKEDDK
ncbi:cell division protein ZapA [Halobacillus salinarum]|uniref:Cell division protein ZapA n=1 Tax=Halobacillus salinarum TaxID=2932257 RepID=A0ABY4ERB7_9BACI|nr:cell division protein ZapA [Halobacillus salinarum]UOQ46199.1 cell division protein ZapA [Halobacillus salinarum]